MFLTKNHEGSSSWKCTAWRMIPKLITTNNMMIRKYDMSRSCKKKQVVKWQHHNSPMYCILRFYNKSTFFSLRWKPHLIIQGWIQRNFWLITKSKMLIIYKSNKHTFIFEINDNKLFFGKCYTMRKILHLCCKFYFKTQPRSFYNRLKVKSKVK